MTRRRTYSHLEGLGRRPSEYEIATSNLLYYTGRGFEVTSPLAGWYERYQSGSPFRASLEHFRDPRETTYASYVELQKTKEIFVDGLFRGVEEAGYDLRLAPAWIATLDRILPTLRYPMHGLQMVAAYVGHMAPEGRVVVASAFQTTDEIRRIQRIAYRTCLLRESHPGFGARSRSTWQDDPQWQPLRRVIERLLVTYDWGEAFVALNLVVKPAFDELFMTHFALLAEQNGDDVLAKLFSSLREDCRWHREWATELVRVATADAPDTGSIVAAWIERWREPAAAMVESFAPLFGNGVLGAVHEACVSLRRSAGLGAEAEAEVAQP